jgi:hypothetical protein
MRRRFRTFVGAIAVVVTALAVLGQMALRVPLRAERLARALMPLHLVVYLLDDVLPLGRFGYHLTVRGRAVPAGGAA